MTRGKRQSNRWTWGDGPEKKRTAEAGEPSPTPPEPPEPAEIASDPADLAETQRLDSLASLDLPPWPPAREPEDSPATPPAEKAAEGLEGTLYTWAQALVAAVVGVVLLFTFLVRLVGVSGPSMRDTLYTGDQLLVLSSPLCDFRQGDVVVVNAYNAQLNDTIVKRIIAVGGQTVDIDFMTGTVYVDGTALDEPYTREPTFTAEGTQFPLTLEEDEVFIMGDNRNSSTDSRSTMLGPVNVGYIQGRAIFLAIPGPTPYTEQRDWSRVGFIR